jgi:cytochrome P450
LTNVIQETLRLHSPAGGLFPRIALEDHFIEELKIKKGDMLNASLYSLAMNPITFPSPLQFDPSRWLDLSLSDPYLFLPFSAGKRNCIG